MDQFRTFRFASAIPWYALIPVAIVLVFLAIRFYRHERALVPGRTGTVLAILRASLPVILLLLLLEPLLSIHWFESLKGRVILLVDSSLSMNASDDRRPDDEKIRLAEGLGLLPEGTRETAFQKLALRAVQDAAKLPPIVDDGKKIAATTPRRAISAYKARHKQAFSIMESFANDMDDLVGGRNRAPGVDKPLLDLTQKLKEQVNAHEQIKPFVSTLEKAPSNAAGIAAYDQSSVDMLTYAAAVLVSVQQTADGLLAKSDDKRIREAMARLDQMKRSEIMARLLDNAGKGLMNQFGKNFYVECYKLSGRDVVEVSPDKIVREGKLAFKPDGKSTDLAAAVRAAAERARYGRETAAVVMLTDGQNNAGDDPEMAAKILAGKNVPLFTVGIGSGEPPRDIAIAELDTSRVVYLGDEVHVGLDIKYDGYQGASAPARVVEGDKVVSEKQVPFPEGRRRAPAELAFIPETVGAHKYVALIPVQPGELIEENNRREFTVDVIDDKIRMLYVEGEPRWEYRFLKNLLLRDKTMEINRIMVTRDAAELPRGTKPDQFPETREQLFKYDVLIIGDIPAERFFPSDLKHIEAFVNENGGVVVMICGPQFNPESYLNTPVSEMMPVYGERVTPTDEVKRSIQINGFVPVLTHEGEDSPITRISFDKLDNAWIWEKLPPLHWQAFIGKAKPGAEVLLKAPGKEKDDCVLLAVQTYGMGKVLLLATDDTWRWRYKVGDKYFHKFWGQVMRWATAGKSSGRDTYIRMGTQKRRYDVGERVEFQAKVSGPDLNPLRDGQVEALVQREDKPAEVVKLEFVPGSEGRYRGTFTGLDGGRYTVRLNVPALPQNPSEAHVEIEVLDRPDVEQVELFLNRPLLESMAKIGGGRYYGAEDARALAGVIEPTKKRIPRVEEIRLWTWPPILLLFTAVVCAEWILRKRSGLL